MEALPELIAENFFAAGVLVAGLGVAIGVVIGLIVRRRRKRDSR
jgi:cellobiose-specific phosphotransferase system component IIC